MSEIVDVSKALDLGIAGLFILVCLFALQFLFKRMSAQIEKNEKRLISEIDETKKAFTDRMTEQREFYTDMLIKQEANCAKEQAYIEAKVKEIKDELKQYKDEDKKKIMEFVGTIAEKNGELTQAVNHMADTMDKFGQLINQNLRS